MSTLLYRLSYRPRSEPPEDAWRGRRSVPGASPFDGVCTARRSAFGVEGRGPSGHGARPGPQSGGSHEHGRRRPRRQPGGRADRRGVAAPVTAQSQDVDGAGRRHGLRHELPDRRRARDAGQQQDMPAPISAGRTPSPGAPSIVRDRGASRQPTGAPARDGDQRVMASRSGLRPRQVRQDVFDADDVGVLRAEVLEALAMCRL